MIDNQLKVDNGEPVKKFQTHMQDDLLRGLYEGAQPLMKKMVNYDGLEAESSSYGGEQGSEDEEEESDELDDDLLEERIMDKVQRTLKVQKIEKVALPFDYFIDDIDQIGRHLLSPVKQQAQPEKVKLHVSQPASESASSDTDSESEFGGADHFKNVMDSFANVDNNDDQLQAARIDESLQSHLREQMKSFSQHKSIDVKQVAENIYFGIQEMQM